MERSKRDIPFESPTIMRLSKLAHEEDVKRNAEPRPFFNRKKTDDERNPKCVAFERRWNP